MQLILLFLLIQWIKCWNVITSKRIVEPINNDSMILNEEYLIQSNGSFSIKYEGIKGYKRLHMIFDAKTNFSQAEILIKVNGIRRSFIVLEENYKEFHVEFEHQASDIKIQFIFGEQNLIYIRNFNLFVDECPNNCKYCLSGYCELEIFDQCEKLKFKDQCVDECPKGYIAEFRECIKTSLNQLGLNQKSVKKDLISNRKFGDSQVLQLDFESNFQGWLEITFNCYGNQENHYNSILKISKENFQPETIHPFLNVYYNTQSYKECKKRFELECLQVKGMFKIDFQQQNNITIYSFSKNIENTGYWNIEGIKIYDKELKSYECSIEQCEKCSFNQVCSQCKKNTFLYDNSCIKQCPYFTVQMDGKCVQIDQLQKDVSFLIKLDSPFQDLQSILGKKTFEMKEEINFRYENGTTFIGGGLKDSWRRTTFTKQLNLGKHYSIRLMFNVSFENSTSDSDCFTYTIDGKTFFVRKNVSYIDHTLYHNKNIFNMNLGCKISSNGRCVISNYYFMTMKCSPLCHLCVGSLVSDCKQYQQNIVNFDYLKLQCYDGYYLDDNGCQKCSAGCSICESYNKCLQCKDNQDGKFYCQPYI